MTDRERVEIATEKALRTDDQLPVKVVRKATCPNCGKVFHPTPSWGYGIGATDYCSWKCTREAERNPPKEPTTSNRSPFNGHLDEISARIRVGQSLFEISADYGRSVSALYRWLRDTIGEKECSKLLFEGHDAVKAARKKKRRKKYMEDTEIITQDTQQPKPPRTGMNYQPGKMNGPLPAETIEEIRQLYRSGKSYAQIAYATGISVSSICKYTRDIREEKEAMEEPKSAKKDTTRQNKTKVKAEPEEVNKPSMIRVWKAIGAIEAYVKHEAGVKPSPILEELAVIEEALK